MNIETVSVDDLHVAPFKATYILRPDLLVLSRSLYDHGFIFPILVQKSTNIVIDGNERLLLAKNQKTINEKISGVIPVNYIDCDNLEAQMLHIKMNRSRGSILAKPLSSIIRNLVKSKRFSKDELDSLLQMKHDEFNLMMDGSILKHRKVSEHKYSRAWVPVEAPAGTIDSSPIIESPPNSDR